ncbi:MAG: long-chain-fatty-acid--CoA ligase [Deltaproteobacteria bacterium]|nr:long-chain-fatty-acid--CoA ligase [Deltaproteobacteria bacterium]
MLTSCYGMTIAELLEKAGRSSSTREALCEQGRTLSYGELEAECELLASGLAQLGVTHGDRVAVCLPTWHEFVVLVFAIARLGAILVPFNTRYRESEAEHILRDCGAKVAFFAKEYDRVDHLAQLRSIRERVPTLRHIVPVRSTHEGLIGYDELRELGSKPKGPRAEVDPEEDVYAIIYTSGTTGKPKGAMLTHANIVYNAVTALRSIRATPDDVFLQATPLFHIMGLGAIVRLVAAQARMVMLESYRPEPVLQLIEREKITVHPGVPTLFALELNHPSFGSYDLSSLRLAIMAGAPCPVEIIRRVRASMGCAVLVSYGMTETSPLMTFTRFEDDDVTQAETVGRALPGVELKVVDARRADVGRGEVGEIACRSPSLMKGYYNQPELTRELLDAQGWFYTGDLGTLDAEGSLRIVGRKKDMIIRGGYNIYPAEVEEALCSHLSVVEAAVVGLPDSVLGEVSCAAVVLRPGSRNGVAAELKDFLARRVADYKVPDHVCIVEELPKTAVGKTQKFLLRELLLEAKRVPLR